MAHPTANIHQASREADQEKERLAQVLEYVNTIERFSTALREFTDHIEAACEHLPVFLEVARVRYNVMHPLFDELPPDGEEFLNVIERNVRRILSALPVARISASEIENVIAGFEGYATESARTKAGTRSPKKH